MIHLHCKLQHRIQRGILTKNWGSSSCWTCLIWLKWFYC